MASDDPIHEDAARPRQGPAMPVTAGTGPVSGDAASSAPSSTPGLPADALPPSTDGFTEPAPTQADAAAPAATPIAAPEAATSKANTFKASSSEATPPKAKAPDPAHDDIVEPDAYEIPAVAAPAVLAARPSPWGAVLSGAIAGAVVAVAASWILTQYVPAPTGASTVRLDALESTLAGERAATAQRLGQLDAALKQNAPPDLQPLTAGIGQVRAAIAKSDADIAALRTQVQSLQTALQGGLDGAKAQAADLGRRVEATGKRIDDVAANAQAMDRAAAAVAILAMLRDAVISGRPFATELDAARAILGPSAGSFDPFAAAANEGYAPPAKLATRLAEQGAAAMAAQPDAPKSGGLVNRLMSSAEGLVRVSPPGGAAATPENAAQLQKAVAAARAGDFDTALAALETLPAPVKEKLQPVITEIEGRRDAANAASTLFQQSLAAISGKVP